MLPDPATSQALPTLDVGQTFEVLAISLGLGGLVGLQRQQAESRIAGIRTFPLITILGTISGLVTTYSVTLGVCLMVVSMVGVIAASGLGNYLRARPWVAVLPGEKREKTGAGITTEMAILVMYAVGVFVVFGPAVIAIAVTGAVVLLLYAKQLLHRFVDNLGEKDVHGIMQFVLLAFIILPVLPDKGYGPYLALNPREIWLVVVLVVGISLGGYIAYRVVGQRAGTVLSGLLGGLIGSTATTVSFARRTAGGNGSIASTAAMAIMLAQTVVFIRVFIELTAVAPGQFAVMAPPIAITGVASLVLAGVAYLACRGSQDHVPAQENPTNLKSAFIFAGLYAVVVLASAIAQDNLRGGVYYIAALSGTTGTDAATLSAGRMAADARLDVTQAWRAVLIAIMANMVFKAWLCAALGGWRLFIRIAGMFLINIAVGVVVVVFWRR